MERRFHVPHPILPAIERFRALVEVIEITDDDCWQWLGGDTFRVDDLIVTTPQRLIYQEATGEKLSDCEAMYQTCKTPTCFPHAHRETKTVTTGLTRLYVA